MPARPCVQSLSGTGSLRVGMDFIKKFLPAGAPGSERGAGAGSRVQRMQLAGALRAAGARTAACLQLQLQLQLRACILPRPAPGAGTTVYISRPTWGNHKNICADAGLAWKEYR